MRKSLGPQHVEPMTNTSDKSAASNAKIETLEQRQRRDWGIAGPPGPKATIILWLWFGGVGGVLILQFLILLWKLFN